MTRGRDLIELYWLRLLRIHLTATDPATLRAQPIIDSEVAPLLALAVLRG